MAVLVDTDTVASEDRAHYWRQALKTLFDARVHVEPAIEREFHGRLSIHRIDRVGVAELMSGPMSFSTTAVSGESDLIALVASKGAAVVEQGGRRCVLHERQIVLCSGSRPVDLALSVPARLASVHVPEDEFLDLFPQGREATLVPIAADEGAPALFADHVDALLRRRDSLDAASARAVADSILHLLGAAAGFGIADAPNGPHRKRARIDRVLRFARSNLRDPDLDVDTIARAVHLSPRQVHRLFEREPMSIMQWVLVQRLEGCLRELRRIDGAARPISEIAHDWGFSDQAHFSRTFRKHFGESPSEVRRRVLAGHAAADDASAPADSPTRASRAFERPACRGCHFRTSKTSR
ncbi:MAG TPA: helix-turn-helix domain-containing protein [Zeimonas sp.]|nr:helix-turn-helix domain-containing protein [Zeimonas sp.]